MTISRLLLATVFIAASAISTLAGAQNPFPIGTRGAVVSTEQVRAELLAWAPEGVEAGKPVWLGLQLTHRPEWHTYWKNSGDSGLPTQLDWQLPAGITAGEIAWPTPKKIPVGTLANYGYEGTVLLPVPLTVAPGFQASQADIKLKASWLVCRQECIPQEGEFSLSLPVKSSTALNGKAFQATFDATPRPLPTGRSQIEVSGQTLKVSLDGLPPALQGQTLALFPETAGVTQPAGAWQQAWQQTGQGWLWTAQVPLSSERTESPARMPLVVSLNERAYRIDAPVSGEWPQGATRAAVPAALTAALQANAAGPALGLLPALLGALLGGLILNLMPCVFPVLAIKVVGFTRHANDRRAHRISGLAYTAGVLLSFLALGALMLGLRAAGEQLGWGFQLQSPAVVAALAVLFTVIGLNLAGLFEFGQFLPSGVAALEARHPVVNSFLSGVLAVAIASPCTAPFMGASLGLAVGLPAAQALAVFAAIGLGMALPYLAAGLVPAVARLLPRPGAWMETFRRLMAFPMFATVAWLVWVLGQQSGIDGAGALLALLVLLALTLWAFTLRGPARTVIATISIALCALAIWAIGPNIIKPLGATPLAAASGRWQAWEPGRVEQLTARGQPVFVDFTAAWCVTCQYNKKTTLTNAAVLADMEAKNVALLRADWTRRDPAISTAIGRLGRSGVPVYVMYKAGSAPQVLSEVLSVEEVRSAIARL
ncbi:protein-disulfide reductase DsbD family protein [Polaromonas jejuensis]|uniref:Protein-disulfide reductase DsbD family protein n=1 Tax=Polaromonas jejuensis TaxID=457502 RepID=A0ABW0QJ95_9BURK|nr:thioredoxin family protein [Polaromonas jejuensis]